MNDEKPIEEVAKAIWMANNEITDEVWAEMAWSEMTMPDDWNFEALDAMVTARAALAVFEKEHTPTDDERQVLDRVLLMNFDYADIDPSTRDLADAILAAGFRRSEPQGEPSDAQVDAVAVAIAVAANAGYWADEIAEWEGSEAWEREAWPDNYPSTAYEDREEFRKQARAALRAAAESGGAR